MTKEFDLIWFYDEVVVPTVAEFCTHRTSIRQALVSSILLFHLLDYIEAERRGGLMYFEQPMPKGVCPYMLGKYHCLVVLQAVANAAKHKHRDRGGLPYHFVGWTFERPPALAGRARAGRSKAGDVKGGVEFHYSGKDYDALSLLVQSMDAIESEFQWLSGRREKILAERAVSI